MLPMSAAPRPAAAASRIASQVGLGLRQHSSDLRTKSEDEIEILDREVDRERHCGRLWVLEHRTAVLHDRRGDR